MSLKNKPGNDPRAYDAWPVWLKLGVSLATELALCLIVYFCSVPNPNMILITGLVVTTSLFGYTGGVPCALVMVLYSLFFFSADHSFVRFTAENGQKLVIVVIGISLTMLFVGQLKKRQQALWGQLRDVNQLLAEQLDLAHCPRDEYGTFVPFGNVSMTPNLGEVPYDLVEGWQCETLESVLALKKRLLREKDLRDIERIEEVLKKG